MATFTVKLSRADKEDRWGIILYTKSDKLIIESILPGGIAGRDAVLRKDDVLDEINGRVMSMTQITLQEVYDLLVSITKMTVKVSRPDVAQNNSTPSSRLGSGTAAQPIELVDSESDNESRNMNRNQQTAGVRRRNSSGSNRSQSNILPPGSAISVVDLVSDDEVEGVNRDDVHTRRILSSPPGSARPDNDFISLDEVDPSSSSQLQGYILRDGYKGFGYYKDSSTAAPRAGSSSIISSPSTNKRLRSPEVGSTSAKKAKSNSVKIKTEFPPKEFGEADITDEVVEVQNPSACEASEKKRLRVEGQISDEIEFVGGDIAQSLNSMPHQREACYDFKFSDQWASKSNNMLYCANCYCYVCEIKASECPLWESHCNATFKLQTWKSQKRLFQKKLLTLLTTANRAMFYQRFVSSDNKKYAIPTESEVTSAPVLDLLRFKVDRHDFNFVNSYRSLLDNISALSLREDRVQNLLMLALHLIDKLSVFWCQWETESSNSTRNSINGYFGILLAITLSPNLFRVERSALFLDLQKVVNDFVDRDSNSSHLQKKKPVQYFVIEKICQSDDAVIEALTSFIFKGESFESAGVDIDIFKKDEEIACLCQILEKFRNCHSIVKFLRCNSISDNQFGISLMNFIEKVENISVPTVKFIRETIHLKHLDGQFRPYTYSLFNFKSITDRKKLALAIGIFTEAKSEISNFKEVINIVFSDSSVQYDISSVDFISFKLKDDKLLYDYTFFASDSASNQHFFEFFVNYMVHLYVIHLRRQMVIKKVESPSLSMLNWSCSGALHPNIRIQIALGIDALYQKFLLSNDLESRVLAEASNYACIQLIKELASPSTSDQAQGFKLASELKKDFVDKIPDYVLIKLGILSESQSEWYFPENKDITKSSYIATAASSITIYKKLTESLTPSSPENDLYRGYLAFEMMWKSLFFRETSKLNVIDLLNWVLIGPDGEATPSKKFLDFYQPLACYCGPINVVIQISYLSILRRPLDSNKGLLLKVIRSKCSILDNEKYNNLQKLELWRTVCKWIGEIPCSSTFNLTDAALGILFDKWLRADILKLKIVDPNSIFPFIRLDHIKLLHKCSDFNSALLSWVSFSPFLVQSAFDEGYGNCFEMIVLNLQSFSNIMIIARSSLLLSYAMSLWKGNDACKLVANSTVKKILNSKDTRNLIQRTIDDLLILAVVGNIDAFRTVCDEVNKFELDTAVSIIIRLTKLFKRYSDIEPYLSKVTQKLYLSGPAQSSKEVCNQSISYEAMIKCLDDLVSRENCKDNSTLETPISYLLLRMYFRPLEFVEKVYCNRSYLKFNELRSILEWLLACSRHLNFEVEGFTRIVLFAAFLSSDELFDILNSMIDLISDSKIQVFSEQLIVCLKNETLMSQKNMLVITIALGRSIQKLKAITPEFRQLLNPVVDSLVILKSSPEWDELSSDVEKLYTSFLTSSSQSHTKSEREIILPGIRDMINLICAVMKPTKEVYYDLKQLCTSKHQLLGLQGIFSIEHGSSRLFASLLLSDKEYEILFQVLCTCSHSWSLDFLISEMNESVLEDCSTESSSSSASSSSVQCEGSKVSKLEVAFFNRKGFFWIILPWLVKFQGVRSIDSSIESNYQNFIESLISSSYQHTLICAYISCISEFSISNFMAFERRCRQHAVDLSENITCSDALLLSPTDFLNQLLVDFAATSGSLQWKKRIFEEISLILSPTSGCLSVDSLKAGSILAASLENIYDPSTPDFLNHPVNLLCLSQGITFQRLQSSILDRLEAMSENNSSEMTEILKIFVIKFIFANFQSVSVEVSPENPIDNWKSFLKRHLNANGISNLMKMDGFVTTTSSKKFRKVLSLIPHTEQKSFVSLFLKSCLTVALETPVVLSARMRHLILILFSDEFRSGSDQQTVFKCFENIFSVPQESSILEILHSFDSTDEFIRKVLECPAISNSLSNEIGIEHLSISSASSFFEKYRGLLVIFCSVADRILRLELIEKALVKVCLLVQKQSMTAPKKDAFVKLCIDIREIYMQVNRATTDPVWSKVALKVKQMVRGKQSVFAAVSTLWG